MITNTIRIPVEWGHCDPARIVFYPHYFFWFDQATRHLFDKVGLGYATMLDQYETVGLPLVDAHAEFYAPTRFGDEIAVTSHVSEWRRKTLVVSHEVRLGDMLAARGTEVRIWAAADPDDPRKLRSGEIPAEFRARFEAAGD